MKELDKNFVNEVMKKFKEEHNLDESENNTSMQNFMVSIAKVSAQVFALSINTMVQNGYFQELLENSDKEP